MANLNVSVSMATGLYTVAIDWNDWNSFTVYDGNQPAQIIPIQTGGTASYSQPSEGNLTFILTANTQTIQPVNPGFTAILAGDAKDNYQLAVTYQDETDKEDFTLTGTCSEVNPHLPTVASPYTFSQVHMTGYFQTTTP